MFKKTCFFVFFIGYSVFAFSQYKEMDYRIQSTFVGGTGNSTAFWGVSNQYGSISVNPYSAMLRTGIFAEYDTLRKKKLDYSYGVELINRVDGKYNITVQQYYVKVKYRFITFQGGRIEEYFGDQDSTLSSGGLLWSGNAQPLPKITIGILNYTSIPFTRGFLEVKGAISHGWFEKDAYVKNEWLHHKYIYFQAGGKLPVKVHFGFYHYAQWGGTSPDAGHLPSSLKDFLTVFRAKQVDGDTILARGNPELLSEYSNRVGNHLGSRNLGFDIITKPVKISFYYQSIFEDNSGLRWHNMPDGLWGLSLKFNQLKWLTGFVYEYLTTTDQSMTWPQDRDTNQPDDYFNHGVYFNGWTYNDFTIGSPLITSPALYKKMGESTNLKNDYLRNNKVKAHHIGCTGIISDMNYKLFITYSKNMGTYFVPFSYTKESVSTYLELTKHLERFHHMEVSLAVANDFGSMYGNKGSVLITIRKRGKLF
jgi:hypothetical protein